MNVLAVAPDLSGNVTVFTFLQRDKQCLPGTRMEILRTLEDWIMKEGDDVPRVHLVSGVAGVGKSTVMHTIAQRAFDQRILAAFYCFDRALQAQRNPQVLFRQVAQ
jgi:2-phosphoglycerate kinase